ncbi:hypothetical protein ACFWBN_01490 [Streptomyces sp. NPDC059989]|uniref:hypothetical protein n=1 Tax=Streptomyces sp. NPDC059989 TaxID=3347026 RepID=UPI0036860FFE
MIVAGSLGFIPGTAQAADPVAPKSQGAALPAVDLGKAAANSVTTFTSPADRSVRRALPQAKGKAAAAPQAEAQAAAGNPELAILLDAKGTTAHGLDLTTTITSAQSSLSVKVEWGDGTSDTVGAYGSTVLKHQHSYAELGEYKITVTVTDAANQAEVANTFEITTSGSDFTPYAPTRVLDTREGIGAKKGTVAPYGITRLKIGGNGGIPEGVTAVALNVTVTNTAGDGFVTVYPDGRDRPTTSNLNFKAGQTVPNLVIVPVGKNGYVDLYNHYSSVDLVADVTGYFTRSESSGYTPLTPGRIVDTREGLGTRRGQVPSKGSFNLPVGPAGRYTAVALNVTVTNPQNSGYLTLSPNGQQAPATSNLNFTTGQTIANSVIVPVGPDGSINVLNGGWGGADVVIDFVGFYSKDSKASYIPIGPFRTLDTREPEWKYGPLEGGSYASIGYSPGEPHIAGYVLNTTVTNTQADGYLSVAPNPNTWEDVKNHTGMPVQPPGSSTLNWTKGKTVPNLVQASSGNHGVVDFWNQSWGNIDLVVDIFGYYETN